MHTSVIIVNVNTISIVADHTINNINCTITDSSAHIIIVTTVIAIASSSMDCYGCIGTIAACHRTGIVQVGSSNIVATFAIINHITTAITIAVIVVIAIPAVAFIIRFPASEGIPAIPVLQSA